LKTDMKKSSIKTSVILGAGLGTRLRPLTDDCPKPLLPLHGRPIITYVMDHLKEAGIERFIVNTHHAADAYLKAFPDRQWRGIPITFRYEPVLLDTGGGIKNVEDLLADDETVIVYNGDIFTNLPLYRLIDAHYTRKKEVTLALRSSGSPKNVNLNAAGDICDMRHTLGVTGVGSYLFAGVYVITKSFLRRLVPGRRESIIDAFIAMIREAPRSVAGAIIDEGRWCDIGSVAEYKKMNEVLAQEEP
ncbi:MAG TPA: nucleotidyltransferase family protein, partial [Syntrophales bacterium]|nr:nucleotidyltransferase family protein [Syntrophales bacterium]